MDKDKKVEEVVAQLKVAAKIKKQGGNQQRVHIKFNGSIKLDDIMW